MQLWDWESGPVLLMLHASASCWHVGSDEAAAGTSADQAEACQPAEADVA